MRVRLTIAALIALAGGALWFGARETSEVQRPIATPTAPVNPAPAATPSQEVEASTAPEPPVPQLTSATRCRPTFGAGEGPPLELTLTGLDLPEVPPKSMLLEVHWVEDGQPRRWFMQLNAWRTTFRLCDESEVSVRRGPYRLQRQRVPRAGAIMLRLEKAAAPSEVRVRTVRNGAPVAGVRVALTGCEPRVTEDGGVVVTSCEQVDEPRLASVRAPWRLASRLTIAADATEVNLAVLGSDEVEPGRVGLGFAPRATKPVVAVLMRGGAAERSGVRIGDEILEVDGIGVATVEETMPRIIGAPGSTVRFKLRRGQDSLLLDVVRTPE